GNRLAHGSGPARLPDEVLARLPVHVRGLLSGVEQLARDANPAPSDEPLLTVEISASPRLVGMRRSALRMHWADCATGRVDNGHVDSNLRGLGNMVEINDPAVDGNIAAAPFAALERRRGTLAR